jgi:hypothetical protein
MSYATYLVADNLVDEGFFEDLAKIAQENYARKPTIAEVLDAIKLTLNQHAGEVLSDMQGVCIEKLTAQLFDDPEMIISSDNPSQLSQLLVTQCYESFIKLSEDFEGARVGRKPRLREILACVAYVSILRQKYLSDAPTELHIREIIPDLVPAPPAPPQEEKRIVLASYPPSPDDLGYIILPNLFDYLKAPDIEQGITLDLNRLFFDEAQQKFMGFYQVPPGTHYIAIDLLEDEYNTWCYLQPRQILVLELKSAKRTYTELRFFEASPETTAHYQHLATTGALTEALLPYVQDLGRGEKPWYRSKYRWSLITQHIHPPQFPPTVQVEQLNAAIDSLKLQESHGTDLMAFLAELEFAFASGYVTYQDSHLDRWNQLLRVLCYSGIEGIAYLGEQLPQVIDIVMVQLQRTLSDYLLSHNEIFDACERFSSDLIDSGIPLAQEKGQELAACIQDQKDWLAKDINSGVV